MDFSHKDLSELAESTVLPFDLNAKINDDYSIDLESALDTIEHDHQGELQVRTIIYNLRVFLFGMSLADVAHHVNDYIYIYRDIARWRVALGK